MNTADAYKKYAETAFEIAIKNCIQPAKKGERRKVKISETDSKKLYSFYREHVKDENEAAMLAIGRASRKAAGKSVLLPVLFFIVALMFVLLVAFRSIWPLITVVLCAALGFYIYWKPRRSAQMIWANRKALKRGTEESLEKMCILLDLPFWRTVSLPVCGGLIAAIIVTIYQTIMLFA